MMGTTREIDNTAETIDSRDVIARIAALEELATDRVIEDDELDELTALKALAAEGESIADWSYGEALIRDSYFEEYAQELAEDIGAIDRNAQWPLSYIDWPAAARALRMDYTSLDFDGVTYWAR